MAYYAAMLSLQNTVESLLNSSHISILPSHREIIQFTNEKVKYLLRFLWGLEFRRDNVRSKGLDSLHEQIREAAYKLQDALDSHVSDQFLSQFKRLGDEDSHSLTFSVDVSDGVLKQEINNFADMVEKMEDKCSELSKYSLADDDDDSLKIGFVGTETKMVGFLDEFSGVKEILLKHHHYICHTFSIHGMAGIGKTTMAEKLYYDPDIRNHFDCRLWIRVGQNYQFRKVMLGLLVQLDYDIDGIQANSDWILGDYLRKRLTSRRYLIVLDDVWHIKVWHDLEVYLPFDDLKSQILVTTRLQQVAQHSAWNRCQKLLFLNEEESWCLLREKVFGEKPCPYQLEKVGKKIAKNCDGLPLLIVTVADLLSKVEKTVEYWTKIAEGKDKSIFIEANDKISDILLRSYEYLRQDSRACFLYMGVFPSKCEITTSKLYNLWIEEEISTSIIDANYCLKDLLSNNLVLKCQDAAIGGTKTCSLHSSVWHACIKQSWKEKFLHAISSFAHIFREGVKSRRRFCTYNNGLFGIKEVYNSMNSISSARSLICSGPNHQYPVPICFDWRLLKVMDALSIRFYKFPIEVVKLIHLRYLALTCNGKIPSSISKLWNLECLIIRRYLSIKSRGDYSYLPVEIWNLQNLRHLQVMGSCLSYLWDALLPSLIKLSGISSHNCTKEIFERIPNLEKLGIQIELAPNYDVTESLSCFDHLSHLNQLHSLKCVIVNPNLARPQVVAPLISITTFPSSLKKLSLSGLGYPWNYMRVITKLPNLSVLKLRNYAFRGPEWEIYEDEFLKLRYLLLEDLDLVHMTFHYIHNFRELDKLIIKHCYKFKKIPLRDQSYLKIKLVDSPLIAKYIQENRKAILGRFSTVHIQSSWDDEKLKA